ncbi:hypothetical protein NDU88_002352 [Pleurodeles waltl]|uniref:Uncharacterized protein n=1 Tax=Pleurodeles waltl TaxID=8319 RepID=A0AAV7Q6E8_PLEWA|nr:hypothetical protein NDU88_002352 [Pleurodeles waltl]
MDKNATTKQSVVMLGEVAKKPGALKPALEAIMAEIQDTKTFLEPKLDVVTIDVNLLWADLQKMFDKVISEESHITLLQSKSKMLE